MPLTPNTWVKSCEECSKKLFVRIHELLDFVDDPRCPECKGKIPGGNER